MLCYGAAAARDQVVAKYLYSIGGYLEVAGGVMEDLVQVGHCARPQLRGPPPA